MTEMDDLPARYREQARNQLAQRPLPGLPAGARPAKVRQPRPRPSTEWRPGSGLPHEYVTRFDPDDLIIDVLVPGPPRQKERPRFNHKTGNVYTPQQTVDAERAWHQIMEEAVQLTPPTIHHVGLFVYFRFPTEKGLDVDNCLKLILDAGNRVLYVDDAQVTAVHCHLTRGCADPSTALMAWRKRRRP